MTPLLRPLRLEDAAELAELVTRNRTFMAPYEPPREESYYSVTGQEAVIRDLLEGEGYHVSAASDGATARALLDAEAVDLVLLDLYLPDVFGLDLLPRMRAEGHECDVMVISAAREAEAVRAAVRLGVVSYLLKPFSFDDFAERLEQYANRRAGLAAAAVRDQADVDRAFDRPVTAPINMLPKGFSSETAKLVEGALRETPDSLSAAECAERIGVSRVSARRYLEQLAETGRACRPSPVQTGAEAVSDSPPDAAIPAHGRRRPAGASGIPNGAGRASRRSRAAR